MNVEQRVAMGAAFGRSLLSWLVDGPPRPISASFAVTNRCNLRCSYCNTPYLDPTDLSLVKVELLLDRLVSLGVKRLGLAGGEPLVRKDIGEIIAMAKARGLYVTLNSNLNLYSRRRDAVKDVDFFFTSLDGDRAHHEAARGEGSHDGVLEAIDSILAGGRSVVAICVVSEHSLDQAVALVDVAEKRGFRVHFQPQCTETSIVRGGIGADLSNERLRQFWRDAHAMKRAGRPVASSAPYLDELERWGDFRVSAFADPAARCAAAWGFFYIDPAGHAYPCAYTKGIAKPIDFLGDEWRDAVGRKTPCTRCSVGPYLEFNMLYNEPVKSALSMITSYA